jgi:hypothetical protein
VHDAVSKFVPSVLEAVLPTLLTTPLSPSQSPKSRSSKPPPQSALTTLGTILGEHVKRSLEQKLESIYADTLSHASYLRDTADTEFLEEVADGRTDLIIAKEDCVTELERVAAEKVDVFREECEVEEKGVGDRIDDRVNMAYDGVCEKIDAYVNTKMGHLRRERGWLGWEKEVFERDKRKFEAAKISEKVERRARVGSAPP